ncbi:MAG TPA: hypothetical protein VKB75_14645 [Jatrophihabitans sp.]|nr:hypothetical protein [Jatrophihabitans sp.]
MTSTGDPAGVGSGTEQFSAPASHPAVAGRHRSLRARIAALVDTQTPPVFEASADPTLLAFAQLFIDSDLAAFDANKHLRTDALSPLYDCETESVREPGDEPELFVVIWAPVWAGTDPVAGFRTGRDSAYLGSTVTVAMPQDERTAALLMLVTTSYVHLSARWDGTRLMVQGAVDAGGDEFRFVELFPEEVDRLSAR